MSSDAIRTAHLVILDAIGNHLSTILGDLASYRQNRTKSEDLDEAIRLARVLRYAASLIGYTTLFHISADLEEILESIRDESQPSDSATSVLETMLTALVTHVRHTVARLSGVAEEDHDPGALVNAVKAFRRLQNQPEADDHDIVAGLLSGAWSCLAQEDGEFPERALNGDDGQLRQQSRELFAVFTEEAEDHINQIQSGLKDLAIDGGNRERIQEIRRAAHTLKGAAGAVGLGVVSELSHRMEDLLDQLYEGFTVVNSDVLTLLASATDLLHDLSSCELETKVEHVRLNELYSRFERYCATSHQSSVGVECLNPLASEQSPRIPASGECIADAAVSGTGTAGADKLAAKGATNTLRVPIARLDSLRSLVSDLMINRASVEQCTAKLTQLVVELQPILRRLNVTRRRIDTIDTSCAPVRVSSLDTASWTDGDCDTDDRFSEFDELEFDRYTELSTLSRSLGETTSDISSIASAFRKLADKFDGLLASQSRLMREAQDRLMKIRMVPFDTITPRLERAVREIASDQQKSVDLVIHGRDTELDKTVLDEIADPLLHLIRNAVDHGIEPAEARAAKGKPINARVLVDVVHSGTQVVIRVVDDGRGLDIEKIRRAAVKAGHVDDAAAASLTPQEVYQYIFRPGLTTASSVSSVSGRGVGMDIVREKIEKLKGQIDVQSRHGTSFTIRLPVSLAVIRALFVGQDEQVYAIPMHSVARVLRIARDQVLTIDAQPWVRIDGATYPLIDFANYVGVRKTHAPGSLLAVVLQSTHGSAALGVERVLPGRDIVVKGLGEHICGLPGLIGATIRGDGTVVPILDPDELIETTVRHAPDSSFSTLPMPSGQRQPCVMIVDDSVSVRRVMANLVEQVGWTSVAANDGKHALELLGGLKTLPDVFLLDIEMPRMDGYELLSNLRRRRAFSDTPVIMISSRSGEKHRQKAAQLGATAFLPKPFQDKVLVDTIRRVAGL